MTKKAIEYANFKTLRSYVNSIFDWAEELEYVERNNLEKKKIYIYHLNNYRNGLSLFMKIGKMNFYPFKATFFSRQPFLI